MGEEVEEIEDAGVGLYRKFRVTRVDGEDRIGGRHDGCALFVLDVTHDMHARKAVARYAQSVQRANPVLAADLRAMLVRLAPVDTYH